MDDLKGTYRSALGARIKALQRARKTLNLPNAAAKAREEIRRIAHSLRGSGASYGFPEVTEAAAALEDAESERMPERLANLLNVLTRVAEGSSHGVSVLIVEDDPEMLRLIERSLTTPGREIFTAQTAAEARGVLSGRKVDLVILDLVLPDMDGRTFLAELRQNRDTAATRVLVLSAWTGDHQREECLALGAAGYLAKPIDPGVLAVAVQSALDGTPVPAPGVTHGGNGAAVALQEIPEETMVVIAEDDDLAAAIIEHRLKREGVRCTRYRDGDSVLDGVRGEPVSLFVLDVKMPGKDGFEVLKELRSSDAHRKTPILMLTALGNEEHVVRGLSLGANDYMTKPFSPVELAARVRRLLLDRAGRSRG